MIITDSPDGGNIKSWPRRTEKNGFAPMISAYMLYDFCLFRFLLAVSCVFSPFWRLENFVIFCFSGPYISV